MAQGATTIVVKAMGVLVAIATSFLSVGLFMAGVAESNLQLVGAIWLLYFTCGAAIGACIPHHWYIAVVVAWLPIVLSVGYVSSLFTGRGTLDGALFMLSPVVALIGGFLGSRIAKRWFSSW